MEQKAAALQLLTVGNLLFGCELDATCHTLLPGSKVEDLATLHTQAYASSTAEGYISKLRAAGLQPGALLSGSARNRLATLLPGAGSKRAEAAFKAYDSCSLSLISLMEVLVQCSSPAVFSNAFLQTLPAWVDADKLGTDVTRLQKQGMPVPTAETEARVAGLLAASGQPDAPHRVCADPSGRLAGLPTSRRHLMCANCGTTSTSVWRAANAGLLCCNACGMFFQKHLQHRPEHLLASRASKKAKHDAKLGSSSAAAAAAAAPPTGDSHDAPHSREVSSDEEWQADAGMVPPEQQQEQDCGQEHPSKRQRTRRRIQANKRLASDDFIMGDSTLSELDSSESEAQESEEEEQDSEGEEEQGSEGDADSNDFESLLRSILSRCHSDASSTADMAAATLLSLKHSGDSSSYAQLQQRTGSCPAAAPPADYSRSGNASPLGYFRPPQQRQQQQHQQQQQPALDGQQLALARAMLRGLLDMEEAPAAYTAQQQQQAVQHGGGLPASQPSILPSGLNSMADVWAQLAQQQQQQQAHPHTALPGGGISTGGSSLSSDNRAGAGSGRQDSISSNSSSSFNLASSPILDGGRYAAAAAAGGGIGGRSMSRFGSEHIQADLQRLQASSLGAKAIGGLPAGARSPRPNQQTAPAAAKRRGCDRRQASGCANCGCESTCLWRRDKFEPSRTLCNACGIYKATNGVDRPLSGRFPARRHGKPLLVKRTAPRPLLAGAYSPTTSVPDCAVAELGDSMPLSPQAAPLAAAGPVNSSSNSSMQPIITAAVAAAMAAAAACGPSTVAAAGPRDSARPVLDLSGVPVTAINSSQGDSGYQQQQQQQQQPEGVQLEGAAGPGGEQGAQPPAAGDAAGPPSTADVELLQQLLGAWGAAQALQRPVLCPSTGYTVFPDGRYEKAAEPGVAAGAVQQDNSPRRAVVVLQL